MKIIEIDPSDRREARRFLQLPFRIYRNKPQWVPPLEGDVKRMLNRRSHPFYEHSKAAFFLAVTGDGSENVFGRLAALDNRHYNDYNQEQTAFFYLFECEDNLEAAAGLFDAAVDWAHQRGLNRIYGPKGFTALDGMGLLVKGFEYRPALGIPYNPPYYATLLEAARFTSVGDTVSGYMNRRFQFPEKVHQVSLAVQEKRGLRIAVYNKRSDLRSLVPKLRSLYNASIEGTPGNTPLTDDEAMTMADQLLWFADPRLIKIVMKEDEPVGFCFAYPDISAALQRTGGRLFPFGWIDILLELRRTRWININGAGMVEKYRGLGGTAVLFSEMYKSIMVGRYEQADIVQIGADNDRMQNEMKNFGIDFYKMHRMYEKKIESPHIP
ncbi:MAG TPA: hypothetical protein VF355_02960 [Anaerolineaceae bacterium]|jgi:hypothetical protein